MRILWRLFFNLLRLLLAPVFLPARRLRRPRGRWVFLKLHPRIVELTAPESFWQRVLDRARPRRITALDEVRDLAQSVASDPRLLGLVVEIPHLYAGWTLCSGLREALRIPAEQGKQVIAYLPEGGGNREVYLALAAERILLGPRSTLMLLGVAARALYYKPLLDRMGIEAQVQAVGEYKTAAEGAVRESMSAPQREQIQALMETVHRLLTDALQQRPGLDRARVPRLFEQGLYREDQAVQQGLADGACYEDEIVRWLEPERDGPEPLIRASDYAAFRSARLWRPVLFPPYVAVVPIRGVIGLDGDRAGFRGASVPALLSALRAVRRDKLAVGVVLYVNSPGGSATASDRIHREVERLKENKPVVACLGEVAASGGYYISACAHKIVARETSITGSIGVVSAKLVARRLFERLGLRAETLRTTPHADMFWVTRAFDQEELEMVRRETQAFYDAFLQIVAKGRQKPLEQVSRLAAGRVWSGADAAEHGLVDKIGGLQTALGEVRDLLPELSDRIKDRLRLRQVRPESKEIPPPEPPSSWAATFPHAMPELSMLQLLFEQGDRVLYYTFGLPLVR